MTPADKDNPDWLSDELWDEIPTTGSPGMEELEGGFAGWAADHQRLLLGIFWTLVATFGVVIAILIGR